MNTYQSYRITYDVNGELKVSVLPTTSLMQAKLILTQLYKGKKLDIISTAIGGF